jgi:glutamate 5-kinase
VVEVNGPFHAGETVRVFSEDGLEVARGLVSCDWQEARQLMGSHSRRTSEILGRPGAPELIHRDNLAVFPREYERPRCTGGSNAAADAPTA